MGSAFLKSLGPWLRILESQVFAFGDCTFCSGFLLPFYRVGGSLRCWVSSLKRSGPLLFACVITCSDAKQAPNCKMSTLLQKAPFKCHAGIPGRGTAAPQYWGYIGVILGIMENKMETTIFSHSLLSCCEWHHDNLSTFTSQWLGWESSVRRHHKRSTCEQPGNPGTNTTTTNNKLLHLLLLFPALSCLISTAMWQPE